MKIPDGARQCAACKVWRTPEAFGPDADECDGCSTREAARAEIEETDRKAAELETGVEP